MKKPVIIYTLSSVLCLLLGKLEFQIVDQIETIICIISIGLFGISHGAIDNHLSGSKGTYENLRFIFRYLIAASLFGLFWYVNSNFAFVVFLIISGYHFGQSQFIDYIKDVNLKNRLLFLSWGVWLLISYIFFNKSKLIQSGVPTSLDIDVFHLIIQYAYAGFLSSSTLIFIFLVYLWKSGLISMNQFFIELFQAFIICAVFKSTSFLLGFTLYFIILHSYRVLEHEFYYLNRVRDSFSIKNFILLLLPFTLVSIAGLSLIIFLVSLLELNFSLTLISIIFISCLTFPHSFVMDGFYQKFKISPQNE